MLYVSTTLHTVGDLERYWSWCSVGSCWKRFFHVPTLSMGCNGVYWWLSDFSLLITLHTSDDRYPPRFSLIACLYLACSCLYLYISVLSFVFNHSSYTFWLHGFFSFRVSCHKSSLFHVIFGTRITNLFRSWMDYIFNLKINFLGVIPRPII